jgi:hypothetical protein
VRAKTSLVEVFFLPGNGARKLDGAELTFVDEVKMTGQLENPKRRF